MSASEVRFFPRTSIEQVEEGHELAPKFDEHGLIPCVTTAAATGEVLMLGYMNAEALRLTITTGEAHYFSRSRQVIWHKGATSGLTQRIVELRTDCDKDCLLVRVRQEGVACHDGYRSCFYRALRGGELEVVEPREVNPAEVYQ